MITVTAVKKRSLLIHGSSTSSLLLELLCIVDMSEFAKIVDCDRWYHKMNLSDESLTF